MPSRRRLQRIVNNDSDDSDEADSEVPVKVARKSFRRKPASTGSKERKREKATSENAYDADSEYECKTINSTAGVSGEFNASDPIPNGIHMIEELDQVTKYDTVGIVPNNHFHRIRDCSVKMTNISPKSVMVTDSLNDNQVTTKTCHKNFQNKENVTPPDSHSTPALLRAASRKLDGSLFGFDTLDPTFPLSPVKDNSLEKSAESLSSHPISPNKRKFENETFGFNDLPIELPKKKQKRKKPVVKRDQVEQDLEMLRSQFEEVEMHELVIESG